MRYFDRRILFPIAAVTAFAQQQSPEAAAAEASLKDRAQEFLQMQMDKKYRQAEAFVAEDSKERYYNGNKFNIKKFSIQKVELLDNNTRGRVTIKTTSNVIIPVAGAVDIDGVSMFSFKVENGQWMYYVDDFVATPFGPMKRPPDSQGAQPQPAQPAKPTVAAIQGMVKIDGDVVTLTSEAPRGFLTISNDLPGGVDLSLGGDQFAAFKANIEKPHLEQGEKTVIRFTATGSGKGSGTVHVFVAPIGTELPIQVIAK
jgi:hypothetical protein